MPASGSSGFKLVVTGDKALDRSLRQMGRETVKELRPALKLAAEPVRVEAASLFAGYDQRSAGSYKIRVRAKGVAIEQALRRTTGLRPDFGSLQMRKALIPALEAHQDDVRRVVNRMVDIQAARAGLL